MTTDRNAFELANLAGISAPDSSDSPGAKWLMLVTAAAFDMIDECAELGGDPSDAIPETVDSIVPIYTHERWLVFTDLCAYNEDISEYGSEYGSDLTGAAGVALYVIAERLMVALMEEAAE